MLRKPIKNKLLGLKWLPHTLLIAGILCLVFGLMTLQPSTPQVPGQPAQQAEELPVTVKPKPDEIDNYAVPADHPRLISIPEINVRARVFSLGLDKQNRIDVPRNTNDTGWFDKSVKPGQPGAMIIDGHVSSLSTQGVFYDLNKLKEGDVITIERGDRTTINYAVVTIRTYEFDKVDMQTVLSPINADKPGLNLITCGGKVIKGTNQFDKRVVVFASAT